MPFSKSTGEDLVFIGKYLSWVNVLTLGRLPTGRTILRQLARLDRPTIESLIESEIIHPHLTLTEVTELVAQKLGGTVKRTRAKSALDRLLRRIGVCILEVRDTLQPAEQESARRRLLDYADQIRGAKNSETESPEKGKMID